ncbi:hypothetical protein [Ekhidna sp.]|uniref:hypothetical protein n=1 Tax=Ekhidna sp. TaxID=2608089 RepID=UPI003C7A8599
MKITISYQPQLQPPPFVYAAVLSVDTVDMDAKLDLEYLDRDTVSDDELSAEGFTHDDDFHWTGKLNQKWKHDIEGLTKLDMHSEPDAEIYAHVDLNGRALGFPKDITHSDLIFQEILQAILEQAKIEMPLTMICYVNNDKLDMSWKFSKRELKVNNKESENWNVGRELIKLIYSLDFEALKHTKKPEDGSVNIGDELWYHMPAEVVSELKSLIRRL